MPQPPIPGDIAMWYAAPDYVRMTINGQYDNSCALYSHYEYVGRTVADWLGENPRADKPWGANGYTGRAIGPVAWGAGYNGLCLQVSGAGAEKVRSLAPPWDNIPRLDIAITIWHTELHDDIARACADWSEVAAEAATHRPWGVSCVLGYGKGDTCYLGSRKSARFGRIYDKYRESGCKTEWAQAWRYEVELKEGSGGAYWEGAPGVVPGPDYWAGIVVSQLRSWGLTMPRTMPRAVAPPDKVPKGETTNARRLRWLAAQVAPSIARLRSDGVAGRDIARALTGDLDPAILWAVAIQGISGNREE